MSLDRNKTQLTHDVTEAAVAWMDAKGFKPVETEVPVEIGWVADVAGVIVPTMTELIELRLLRRKPNQFWKLPQECKELWAQQMKSLDRTMTALVEVKTSRSDFCGDNKWGKPLPSDLAYLAVPSGMIRADEWPSGWGVLEYHADSATLRCTRPPNPQTVPLDKQFSTVLSVAIRRDHRTRYAELREAQRERRIRENDEVSRRRLSSCIRAVLSVANGRYGSVKDCLSYHGVRGSIPDHDMRELEKLWAITAAK